MIKYIVKINRSMGGEEYVRTRERFNNFLYGSDNIILVNDDFIEIIEIDVKVAALTIEEPQWTWKKPSEDTK